MSHDSLLMTRHVGSTVVFSSCLRGHASSKCVQHECHTGSSHHTPHHMSTMRPENSSGRLIGENARGGAHHGCLAQRNVAPLAASPMRAFAEHCV
jgi:hypothetical protein